MRRRHRFPTIISAAFAATIAAACGASSGPASPSSAVTTSSTATVGASPGATVAGSPATSDVSPLPVGSSATAGPTAAPTAAAIAVPYPMPPVQVRLEPVVSKLDSPVAAASPGDGRLFVVEQTGRIVIVENGAVTATFLDLSARISCCGERGLLGLAFHPDYAVTGRFFVRYTARSGDVIVSEFRRGSSANAADPASERVLLTVPHGEFPNHNGGAIAFGPDGYLYVGTGDGGGTGDPHGNGQNVGVLLGKLLRIDVDAAGGAAYAIPSDNPLAGRAGARPEIFAYGLRNPYEFSFDRATGDLWIADVGQNSWEEVDRARAADGGGRGLNFGWNVMEGRHCYSPSSGCATAGKTPPVAEYGHSGGNGCAIIGGFVYRGAAHPDLAGRYFFADDCSGRVWDLSAAGPNTQAPQQLLASGPQITGWGQGSDGELYVLAANGTLYHLV